MVSVLAEAVVWYFRTICLHRHQNDLWDSPLLWLHPSGRFEVLRTPIGSSMEVIEAIDPLQRRNLHLWNEESWSKAAVVDDGLLFDIV